jgi:hypothetical protein
MSVALKARVFPVCHLSLKIIYGSQRLQNVVTDDVCFDLLNVHKLFCFKLG